MSFNSHQIQAEFARRREKEHLRQESTTKVNRYYDHWDKVNSRYQNWTKPSYYLHAEERREKLSQLEEKKRLLQERQEKLRTLLADEKRVYEEEQRRNSRPSSSRFGALSVQTLAKIQETARERERTRKRLEMEARMYGRLRHGKDDENLLYEARSDHEVLARLNWVDKRIEEEAQRERDKALAEERNLRLQEELAKIEQMQKERHQLREQEIKEIRALQERHIEELKERQAESDLLKEREEKIRCFMDELKKETELLEESTSLLSEPGELSQAYNLKKIKMYIRKRSRTVRQLITMSLSILERLEQYAAKREEVASLHKKWEDQLNREALAQEQLEAMYESEAKAALQICEDEWQSQHMERYRELKQLLEDEMDGQEMRLNDNLQRQSHMVDLRSAHLTAIDNANEKLSQLIQEQEDSPRTRSAEAIALAEAAVPKPTAARDDVGARRRDTPDALKGTTKSFHNLNLDGWEEIQSPRGDMETLRLEQNRKLHVVTADNAAPPKFGRRRVAWT